MALLEVKNLGIAFGGLRALKDVQITIENGEIVGLIEERYDVSVIYDPSSFDDTAYRLGVGNNEPLGQMLDILNLIVPIEYTVQDRRVLIKRKR